MKTETKKYLKWVGILVLGIFLGWVIFGGYSDDHAEHSDVAAGQEQVWTCSMHPQIRQEEPGDCPICGMDLIPLEADEMGDATTGYSMSENAMRLANVETMIVGSRSANREIRLNGKVQIDERNSYSQSTHIPGRIERLNINFTGERVQRGQTLATVYSPEMVTAQEELLQAARIRESQPELFQAAREKLRNWRIGDAQIDRILSNNTPIQRFPITADVAGVVTEKMVNLGDYVERGMPLYQIADLSRVWVLFDLYESDLAAVREGDEIEFRINSLPGETFEGSISFIDPLLGGQTRVATARVEVENKAGRLKPEMFATGIVEAGGTVESPQQLTIPNSAVLWTGKRSVVYVKEQANGRAVFNMREVTLGNSLGNSYVVLDGLEEGEEIVTNGTFTIDAAVQLSGRASMMNPEQAPMSTGHDHGDGTRVMEDHVEVEVGEPVKNELRKVLNKYLELKDALVSDNSALAGEKAKELEKSLSTLTLPSLSTEEKKIYDSFHKEMTTAVKKIIGAGNIEAQREHFIELSTTTIGLVKTFQLSGDGLYVQRCPMANSDRGANWLSRSNEIRNPYFGSSMLTCGEVIETIN
ncbi:efflux RND transporter periplasmic adaptor subunit [Antarcticibacterium flavum]|uniref:Efflux RND transporter periplasmic adaptor subunit n=1 Tax=Antarcticibacterium flavum TaxID=2058175 RepID=A0A5B7X1W0_9FLAO|nr:MULTISPECIES: efflux RND transporter periplasmic adaptor subunit [Antarcticibacterium]MCM4161019.1 efflux RND transporter periplasmic adaptor subunit [Antarcticibacterium sp. W02-3]QCY69260.1 efflux RND transporter periplasmic adaptor subunit [Antarcticibacterium flavum]